MSKTNEEIQALKDNWAKDPIWDIEDTEGFEEHREELLAWRKDRDEAWEKLNAERESKRIDQIAMATGLRNEDNDRKTLLALSTFAEIENEVKSQDRYIGSMETRYEISHLELLQSQVRATLLLAAQVKRIADVLENMDGRDSLAETVAIWGKD